MFLEEDPSRWSWKKDADLIKRWPKGPDGEPERAVPIATVGDMGGEADIKVAMLEGYGIPAFKEGTLGRVLMGFAAPSVELYVPASLAEDARVLLTPPEDGEQE